MQSQISNYIWGFNPQNPLHLYYIEEYKNLLNENNCNFETIVPRLDNVAGITFNYQQSHDTIYSTLLSKNFQYIIEN